MYEAVFLSHVWANLHFNNHCSTLSPAVGVLRDFNRWLLGAHTVIPYYCFNVQVPDCSDVGQFSIPWQSPCTLSSMKFLLIWAHFCIFLLPSALEKLIFWLLLLWWLSVSSVSSPTWWLSIQHSQGCLLWKVLHFIQLEISASLLKMVFFLGCSEILPHHSSWRYLLQYLVAALLFVSLNRSSAHLLLILVPIWARGAVSFDWVQIPCWPQSDWNAYLFVTSFYHLFYYTWCFLWLGFISRFPILFH